MLERPGIDHQGTALTRACAYNDGLGRLVARARQATAPDRCRRSARVHTGGVVRTAKGPTVATLGINPSSGEFLDRTGALLDGPKRRLATSASLGHPDPGPLDGTGAAAVIADCANYFHRQPYTRWFNPLDRLLRSALGVSYYEDTASHLDLVQWATKPVWGGLDDAAHRQLLAADLPFLRRQLTAGWAVVLVNGKTVMDWVEGAGLLTWRSAVALPGPPRTRIGVADVDGVRFIGWSANLQSQPGALSLIPGFVAAVRTATEGFRAEESLQSVRGHSGLASARLRA